MVDAIVCGLNGFKTVGPNPRHLTYCICKIDVYLYSTSKSMPALLIIWIQIAVSYRCLHELDINSNACAACWLPPYSEPLGFELWAETRKNYYSPVSFSLNWNWSLTSRSLGQLFIRPYSGLIDRLQMWRWKKKSWVVATSWYHCVQLKTPGFQKCRPLTLSKHLFIRKLRKTILHQSPTPTSQNLPFLVNRSAD